MKMHLTIISALLLSFLLFSCNDSLGVDDNVKEEDKDKETGDWGVYTRLSLGDYMIFDEYLVNQNFEDVIFSKNCRSEVVDTNRPHYNIIRSSYTKTTMQNGSKKHELFAYIDGSKLYISRKTLAINVLRFDPCEVLKGDDFILWVDFEKDIWPCDYIEMNESIGNGINFDGIINITGRMDGDTVINIGEIEYKCKISTITTTITGTFTKETETFTFTEPYVITYTSYFAKNGGIIYSVVDISDFHGCEWFGTSLRNYISYKYIATEVNKQ